MDVDIHATVFQPTRSGEPYFIVASAFSLGRPAAIRVGTRTCGAAATIDEAVHKCCELARALKSLVDGGGIRVRTLHCSHCPRPDSPVCGKLAGF